MLHYIGLDQSEIIAAAQAAYPNAYVEYDTIDFYVRDIANGTIKIEGMETPFFVSTNYVYEDHMINGNDTRFKSKLSIVTIKKDRFEVLYDSYGKMLVAYKEDGEIKLIPYEDFYDVIKSGITVIEKKEPLT